MADKARKIKTVDMYVVLAVHYLGGKDVSVPEMAQTANLKATSALYNRIDDLTEMVANSPALLDVQRCKDEGDRTVWRFSLTKFGKEVVSKMDKKNLSRLIFFRLVNLKEID